MYCKNCGKLLAGDEKFCSNCGVKVEREIESIEPQEEQKVDVESFPTSNMVWDLDDFENQSNNGNSDFVWGTENEFSNGEKKRVEREQDAADYKGPLMFRKEEKAPSREEIEKKEKEEESTKKSTLYADDGNKGEGNRWDITKVEIPDLSIELDETAVETVDDKDADGDKVNKREFYGFVKPETEDTVVETQDEPKKEFKGFIRSEEEKAAELINADKEAESKEELQAVLDQAIDQAIEQDFPSKREKKDVVFNWGQDVSLPTFDKHIEEAIEDGHKDEAKPMSQPEEIDKNVENNKSMTLEELAAGINIKADKVPASNYDETKKTIRNVLSKDAMKQTISFSMDNVKAVEEKLAAEEAKKLAERKAAEEAEKEAARKAAELEAAREQRRVAARKATAERLEAERLAANNLKEDKSSVVVDIEQPKKSNISLEIHEDDVTGDKIEKVIDDEPKVPEETLSKAKTDTIEEPVEKAKTEEPLTTDDNMEEQPSASEQPDQIGQGDQSEALGFTHKEINDDIKVGEYKENQNLMDQILNPTEDDKDDDDRLKFYTFNKNKEEFQKLLDQEYERLNERENDTVGYEEDIAGFMNIERGKNVEATSQIEEMNKARSVFLNRATYEDISVYDDEDFDREDILAAQQDLDNQEVENQVSEEAIEEMDNQMSENAANVMAEVDDKEEQSADVEPEEVNNDVVDQTVTVEKKDEEPVAETTADPAPEKVRIVFEPQKDESLADTLREKEQAQQNSVQEEETEAPVVEKVTPTEAKAEPEVDESSSDFLHGKVGKLIIDPKEMTETEKLAHEFFEDDDETEKRSKGKNILLGIITVIIVIVIAFLGIKIIIPESPISKVMDDIGDKVISTVTDVFGGDEGAEADKTPIRETAMEDKTKLIQSKIDMNYNNNIEDIISDDRLKYDSEEQYELADLVDAKDIQTVLWYKDEKGNPFYYDEEIVGTIIEFVSMKAAWQNKGDKAIFGALYAGTEEYDKIASLERYSSEQLVSLLAIGDIKVAGNSYYVWTSETVGDNTVKHVYEIKEQDQRLYVNDDCEI